MGATPMGGKTSWIGARMPVPTLRGLTSKPDADWEELIDFIEEGHRAMPRWSGVINRPNIRRIVEYLDTLDRPELYPTVDGDEPSSEPTECDTTEPAVPVEPSVMEEPESWLRGCRGISIPDDRSGIAVSLTRWAARPPSPSRWPA